ncbi:hypothetical protein [Kribbella jiaozuonensis]|uniref:TetR family transcriptional regulator n=1 Tax=Kribbella jiaozuonensis TaxID=2575441 RepID=A0A4U3LH14_9ACTN|nr:hypothetical protein [Kribbella jiaozuonensis]TKK74612.1 hypothetical protein FDA38_38310 [Kribbella jiaozuonensis]
MTPRPPAARDDASAGYFLDAAAELIDGMFDGGVRERPHRLRGIHFPAALEWMRVSDVVELAQERHGDGASEKAFRNRWPDRNTFVKAAIIHTMLYRDAPESNPALYVGKLPASVTAASLTDAVIELCDGLLKALQARPRSYLLHHIGPLLDQYPDLRAAIIKDIVGTREPWFEGYAALLGALQLNLRPGWTIERVGLALQAMLDGFLFRSRVQPEEMKEAGSADASLFAETVICFILGVLDLDASRKTTHTILDETAHTAQS